MNVYEHYYFFVECQQASMFYSKITKKTVRYYQGQGINHLINFL